MKKSNEFLKNKDYFHLNIPFYISRRYLFSKKSRNIINIISGISMVVVAAVTAAMIIVLSALNGIEELVEDLFSKFETELTLLPTEGKVFEIGAVTLSLINNLEGVRMTSRVIEDDVWVRNNSKDVNAVCTIKGVEPYYGEMTGLDSMVHYGDFTLEKDGYNFAVPGYGIFSDLKIPHRSDPEILVINAPIRGKKLSKHKEKAFKSMPIMVNSTYSVNAELDVKYIFAPINFCRELFNYPTQISALEIALDPNVNPLAVKEKIELLLDNDKVQVVTREDKNALIFKTNESEKWATFLILLFILIIAAFNIVASLSMLIIEKKKDIFILRSMGAREDTIQRIFIQEGVLIYFIGAIVGLFVGILIVWSQQQFGLIKITGATVTYYPVKLILKDLIIVLISVMAVGLLFSNVLVRRLLRRYVQ